MAVSDLMAEVATALTTQIVGDSGGSSTRMTANLLTDRDQVTSTDAPKFQLIALEDITGEVDSAGPKALVGITILAHHLVAAAADAAAIDGYIQDNIQNIIQPSFWSDLVQVNSVTESPEVSSGDIVRIGNVISFTLTVQVRLV